MSLRRTKSAIISWAGSFIAFVSMYPVFSVLPLDGGGGLRSLIVAIPGVLLIGFFVDCLQQICYSTLVYNLQCNFNAKLNLLKIRHDKDESSVDILRRIIANQSFKNDFVITSCIRNLLLYALVIVRFVFHLTGWSNLWICITVNCRLQSIVYR